MQAPCQDLWKVQAVAIEGGGVLGISYVPILEEVFKRSHVRFWAGASAGSILSMLGACGASIDRIREILYSTHWERFGSLRYRPGKIIRLIMTGGMNESTYMRGWIEERLRDLGFDDSLTFSGLREKTGNSLYVTATNESSGKAVLFSPETCPSQKVSESVLASASIPIFWPSVRIGDDRYSDGGLTWNHPIDVFSQLPCEQILGMRVDSGSEINDERLDSVNPLKRAVRLAQIARQAANGAHVSESLWKRIVRVDSGTFSAIKFHLTDADIAFLLSRGSEALAKFLSQ